MFDFTLSGLISSLLFGIIGYWMYREGKKRTEFRILIIGLLLMIYPYFTNRPLTDWGVGFALCGLAYYIWPV